MLFATWAREQIPQNYKGMAVTTTSSSFLKRFYLFIFRERGREVERGEKLQRVVASPVPTTRDLARNPGMCPDWELNQRPFGLQAGTQSAEPHQPGPAVASCKKC